MSVHLVIPGRPRPGERAGTTPDGRRYSQENTLAVQRDVAMAWMTRPEPWRSPLLECAVAQSIIHIYRRPSPHFLTGGGLSAEGLRHPFPTTTRADLDNIAKPILDGLTGKAWRDDRQVCHLTIDKVWDDGRGERTEVRISPMVPAVALHESVA